MARHAYTIRYENHIRKRHLPCRTLEQDLKFSRFQAVKKLRRGKRFPRFQRRPLPPRMHLMAHPTVPPAVPQPGFCGQPAVANLATISELGK